VATQVFDGKALVNKLTRKIKRDTERLRRQHHIEVGLGILLVTGDQVSMADSGKIAASAEQCGIKVHTESVAQRNVARRFYPTLEEYSRSPFIQGIYIQLPLPTEIVPLSEVMNRLPVSKDVAGLHFVTRGMSTYPPHEVSGFINPPELLAITETLSNMEFEFRGGKVVIVGSNATSGIVKLLAGHLFDRGCNVNILRYSNIVHSDDAETIKKLRSVEDTIDETESVINPHGEAVISWTNHGQWLTGSRLSKGSIVIDLGYKFARGKISGDVDFQSVSRSAKYVTPVPGGVRSITHMMILNNLIELIRRQKSSEEADRIGGLKRRFQKKE